MTATGWCLRAQAMKYNGDDVRCAATTCCLIAREFCRDGLDRREPPDEWGNREEPRLTPWGFQQDYGLICDAGQASGAGKTGAHQF